MSSDCGKNEKTLLKCISIYIHRKAAESLNEDINTFADCLYSCILILCLTQCFVAMVKESILVISQNQTAGLPSVFKKVCRM